MVRRSSQKEEQKETVQFNVRLPKDLLDDLSAISSIMKIHKAEWLKGRIAEAVMAEKLKLLEDASRLRNAGAISEEDFSRLAFVLKPGNGMNLWQNPAKETKGKVRNG